MQNQSKHIADGYVISFQNGIEEGFDYFFRELYAALTMYCNKITANKEVSQEIASNAFIKIWEKHERFTEAHSIKAYLYRIVRNDALKYLKKEKLQASANKEVVYIYGGQQEKDHFNSLVTAESYRLLLDAIKLLPEQCSKVFHLLYVEGKSIKEVAEQLDITPSTVKTQKGRGLTALRKQLPYLSNIMMLLLLFPFY